MEVYPILIPIAAATSIQGAGRFAGEVRVGAGEANQAVGTSEGQAVGDRVQAHEQKGCGARGVDVRIGASCTHGRSSEASSCAGGSVGTAGGG